MLNLLCLSSILDRYHTYCYEVQEHGERVHGGRTMLQAIRKIKVIHTRQLMSKAIVKKMTAPRPSPVRSASSITSLIAPDLLLSENPRQHHAQCWHKVLQACVCMDACTRTCMCTRMHEGTAAATLHSTKPAGTGSSEAHGSAGGSCKAPSLLQQRRGKFRLMTIKAPKFPAVKLRVKWVREQALHFTRCRSSTQ